MVLVSHDFRLISQVCEEIWECKDGNITKWNGTIEEVRPLLFFVSSFISLTCFSTRRI